MPLKMQAGATARMLHIVRVLVAFNGAMDMECY